VLQLFNRLAVTKEDCRKMHKKEL